MGSIIANVIVCVILIALVGFGIVGTVKHFKGQGACCGGGGCCSIKEQSLVLDGPTLARKKIYIQGMKCQNCVNAVTRGLQKIQGVSARVELKENVAYVELDREVLDQPLILAVESAGYKVLRIEEIQK